jgi:hypothetical protein
MTTEILIPSAGYGLTAVAPYVLQSCVLVPPLPPSAAEPEDAIFAPVPPGVDYGSLPVLDTEIIDTSPSQIIGCANTLPEDGEQAALNALFPSAIDGDGVVNRQNNDIWKYDGTTWENVGPTPGPQVVVVSVLPPWNEIAIYDATVRTRLQIQSLNFALALLTEPDPISIIIGLDARKIKEVPVSAAAELALATQVPAIEIRDPAISLVVSPYNYVPTGSTLNIDVGYEPGIVWTRTLGEFDEDSVYIFDMQRGPTKYMRAEGFQVEQTDAQSITAFTPTGFTVGTSTLLNNVASVELYGGHAFLPAAPAVSNTSGTITSTVSVGNVYSIITYNGNGVAGATVGHGMSTTPQLIILHRLGPSRGEPQAGGPVVGDNHTMIMDLYDNRLSSTDYIRSANANTITLGLSTDVNGIAGSSYLAYAFRNEPKLSKIDTYVGNGDVDGQFIDCGFTIDYLLVKKRDGGVDSTGEWCLFDRTNLSGKRVMPWLAGVPYFLEEANHRLDGTGFTALRGENDFSYYDINENGATYLYMAFARVIPTVQIPTASIAVEALAPVLFVSLPTASLTLGASAPAVSTGVTVAAPTASITLAPESPQRAGPPPPE